MQNFLQNNKFFVSKVTICDIFIQDLNDFLALMFFYKIDFCLKISYVPYFAVFVFFYQPIACSVFQGKIWHFSLSIFLKYEKLII